MKWLLPWSGSSNRRRRSFWVIALLAMVAATVSAQTPAYLSEMPTADRVIADMRAGSTRESAVRASLALSQLASMVQYFSGAAQKRTPLPAEAAKMAEYQLRAAALFEAEEAKTGGQSSCGIENNDCEYYLLNRCASAYTFSAGFRREILDRYFSPQWQAQYARQFANV